MVWLSPEQLSKIMGVIVVIYVASGLTVSEAYTETMGIRAKGIPEPTGISSVAG